MALDAREQEVRAFVLGHLVEHTSAPSTAEIARGTGIPLAAAREALEALERAHHLQRLPGTSRILMAFPFSAIATPFRVERADGRRYFANCAWDAIAFHPMLDEPIRIESYCDRCAEPIRFRVEGGRGVDDGRGLPAVRLARPAAEWWNDIVTTCANTMVFLGPEEPESPGAGTPPAADTGVVSVDQVAAMSVPLYAHRLDPGFERPPPAVVRATFERLGLVGPHWRL